MNLWGLIMERTIANFKQKNAEIIRVLDRVQSKGLVSDLGQQLFFDSKEMFLSHFQDEERVMHPLVIECVKDDFYLSKTLSFFLSEVASCQMVTESFFSLYPSPRHGLTYAEQLGEVFAAIQQRTRLEEHAIYGIYEEQLLKKSNPYLHSLRSA